MVVNFMGLACGDAAIVNHLKRIARIHCRPGDIEPRGRREIKPSIIVRLAEHDHQRRFFGPTGVKTAFNQRRADAAGLLIRRHRQRRQTKQRAVDFRFGGNAAERAIAHNCTPAFRHKFQRRGVFSP